MFYTDAPQKAETLRTRLQLALYKIQTNQTTAPFARLQVPKPRSPSPEPHISSSSPKSSSTLRPNSVQDDSISLEARVAAARARATSGLIPTVRPLSALPMPQLAPTAFSARWNNEFSVQESQSSQTEPTNIPSSPPLSQVSEVIANSNLRPNASTVEPRTPLQLSDPIASQGEEVEEEEEVDSQSNKFRPHALTSSVVKGEAANSLLELVKGARSGGVGMCGL